MKKRKRPLSEIQNDKKEILAAGFKVIEKSPVHWHIRKEGSHEVVNVWPTVSKYMLNNASGANHYKDVVKSISGLFSQSETTFVRDIDPQAKALCDQIRLEGLSYFKRLVNS